MSNMQVKEKLYEEVQEIKGKIRRLEAFRESDKFDELGSYQQAALLVQHHRMIDYLDCVAFRLLDLCAHGKDGNADTFFRILFDETSPETKNKIRKAMLTLIDILYNAKEDKTVILCGDELDDEE